MLRCATVEQVVASQLMLTQQVKDHKEVIADNLLENTWASLLPPYPTTLVYFLFPDTTFISSGSTNPTKCIYTDEINYIPVRSRNISHKLKWMQSLKLQDKFISQQLHPPLLKLRETWFRWRIVSITTASSFYFTFNPKVGIIIGFISYHVCFILFHIQYNDLGQ